MKHKKTTPISTAHNNLVKISPSSQAQGHYDFIDGFRAIAMIMILTHHIRRGFNLDNIFENDPPLLKRIFYTAWDVFKINLTQFFVGIQHIIVNMKGILGVEMFLVISGFLITKILLRGPLTKDFVFRFYQRRFFRIYPVYFLVVMLSLGVYAWQNQQNLYVVAVAALQHLFFLQNYFPLHPFLSHTWTLVVLEQYYFFCPLIILAVNRFVPERNRRKTLIGICLSLIAISPLIRIYCLKTGQPLITWPFSSPTPYWTILHNLGPLCLGCLLALLEPYWSLIKKNIFWGIVYWGIGAALVYYLYFCLDWSYYWGPWYLYTLGYLSTGLLLFAAYHGISVFANLKSFQWLGRNSYGIYIWHFLILELWKPWYGTVIPPALAIIGCFVTSIIAGVLSTRTVESYFLSLREKRCPRMN
ncbi:MAG: acyltransferase [Candidatus Omnitrophica bacterium]|nr:acyltransferase [Candidatus Omnitrophota bacterium]